MKKLILFVLMLALLAPMSLYAYDDDITIDSVIDEKIQETVTSASRDRSVFGDEVVNVNRKWKFQLLSWETKLTGHIQIAGKDSTSTAEKITFGQDITFAKEKIPGFRASYALGGRTTFELSYANQDHDGHLSFARTFKDKNFNIGASLKFQNEWIDMAWIRKMSHKFNEEGHEKFYWSGIFGIKTNYTNIELSNPVAADMTLGARAEWAQAIPIPYIGIEGGMLLGKSLWLRTNCRIFKLNYDGYSAEHHDYTYNVAYRLNKESKNQDWFFNAGYRDAKYDITGKGDEVVIKYKGPIFGFDVHF